MKKQYLFIIFVFIIGLACKKQASEPTPFTNLELMKFKLCDSALITYDAKGNGGKISENHNPMNRDLELYKNKTTGEIIYKSDTFRLYQNSPLTYSNKNGSFPLLGFSKDSLSIYKHLGGVGYQTWEYLICVKK
jgi:hypothetical protein